MHVQCVSQKQAMNNSYCQDFRVSNMFIILEREETQNPQSNPWEAQKGGDRCGRGSQEEREMSEPPCVLTLLLVDTCEN